ncbi:aspartate aminotransferase family protein [Roseomonas frigidaquae]|uniref:Aspartate aminotransferase family protein n=1 Tax=Falsiroseomonas frigidaquae TaxID=487318 RepID=A0ABX1EXD5_9PROT|nr:aspartate aminotransferase family protein [Falsiroseomonas frigidaquae]NKE44724.1 aspartate aminotransferase family protein [Falsiroseomonas frigidaquae]
MRSHLIQRNLRQDPPLALRGEGIFLHDSNGRTIIDGSGGAAVACLGHGHPRVLEAMRAQMDKLTYAHTALYSCESAEALADLVLEGEPGGLSHLYLCSSGSEAMEAALKLSRQHFVEAGQPNRRKYIARRQSYHGNTLGALAAGGNAMRKAIYQPILSDAFSHVAPCYAYRDRGPAESDADYVARLAAELEAEFQRLGPDTVIGFIAEPVVGATLGCVTALPGYFPAMRAVCDRHGALLILDEVMCGMGRTGTMHAWEQEGVTPDIQVVAKGLGGGYQPIGGILANNRVMDALRDGSGALMHGHTYQAHPMAAAAALAVQRVIREEKLLDNVQAMGALLEQRLVDRLGNHRHVGEIRGRGLFWAAEFVADRASKAPFDPALKLNDRIKQEAYARGLACYPMAGTIDGRQGDHVLLAPPYIATAADIEATVARFGDAVDAALAGLPVT